MVDEKLDKNSTYIISVKLEEESQQLSVDFKIQMFAVFQNKNGMVNVALKDRI